MTCSFARDDAAYVLGALSPGERLDFERHLGDCDACPRAVREFAGLPGLLGRIDASVLERPPADEPLPATLLPSLSHEVRRGQRRRTRLAVGVAAAAAAAAAVIAAVIAAGFGSQVGGDDASQADVPGPSSASAGVQPETMDPVGEVPVRASLSLEQVTWGTRLGLTCTYDPDSVDYELPPEVDYALFVRTLDGRAEHVGSWRSVGGKTMQLSAATAASRDDIASVEVRTLDGRVVLRLAA